MSAYARGLKEGFTADSSDWPTCFWNVLAYAGDTSCKIYGAENMN
jgi:hypothetical protein